MVLLLAILEIEHEVYNGNTFQSEEVNGEEKEGGTVPDPW